MYADVERAIQEKLLESETLEYKADPGGRLEAVLAKGVSALANSAGGHFILGVGEGPNGEPLETDPGMPMRLGSVGVGEQVDRLIRSKVVPSPPAAVEVVEHPTNPERTYVIVTVAPRGGGPYRITQTSDPALNGRYYVRRGRESVEADHYVLRSLFRDAEEGRTRIRDYLARRGLGDETDRRFGLRQPFASIPTVRLIKRDGDPPVRDLAAPLHRVAAFAIPETLRGPVVDTGTNEVNEVLTQKVTPELRGFGHRQEPTLDGRWLVQRVPKSTLLGSYVEVHRTGYVEVSHPYAGVRYEDRKYIDAGAALLVVKAALAVAARVREIAGVTDGLLIGLAVYHSQDAELFAWEPDAGRMGRTIHPHVRVELLADEEALRNPVAVLLTLDERLGNAFGLDRTEALTEGGHPNRLWHPLDGEWL